MRLLFISLLFGLSTLLSYADSALGVVNLLSQHDVKTTTTRLEEQLEAKGMHIFARINHAEGAKKVDKVLRPTELVIFGNPKVGTLLMQCNQSVAIDLPQKALVWEDEQGKVWLSYNDPYYLAKRHDLKECEPVIEKVAKALGNFAQFAVGE